LWLYQRLGKCRCERHGTANLFTLVEPLAGRRHAAVTERRTKHDYAEYLRYLVEECHPMAEQIYLVQDHLNTHSASALYEAFAPPDPRQAQETLPDCPNPTRLSARTT
jgi:hypothetical protein